jgi:hypothetical protein
MSKNTECWAIFTCAGGYDYEQVMAKRNFVIGQKYKILSGKEGRSYTRLTLDGIEGEWNSALFDFDRDSAPLVQTWKPLVREVVLKNVKSYPAEMDGNSYYAETPIFDSIHLKFVNYANNKGWNTEFNEEESIFLNRGVQESWELWQAARKAF